MNYDVSKDTLAVRELVFEGCQELPIDIDFSLPDYCPDIQRILKCQVCPNITMRNISGDRLNLEGTASIRMIYLDAENMKIRCCENSSPFSSSIDIKSAPENGVATTFVKVEYVNCRAVSQRKVDIHGAFSICAKVYNKASKNVSCCVSGKDIQQKIENRELNSLIGIGQQQFTISEMLDIAENKPAPERIVRSDVTLIMDEYKNMANKVVVKGEATVKILYMGDLDSDSLETMEYSIPISQIVDVLGAAEDSVCVITSEVLNHDEQIHSENAENPNLISTEIKIAATVMAYSNKTIGIVSDIYSTDYDLETTNETLKLDKLIDTVRDSFSHKATVELSDLNASKVIDVWSDACSANCRYQDGKLVFTGKMSLGILAADTENTPFYIERIIEFEHSKNFEHEMGTLQDIIVESSIQPVSMGHSISQSNAIDIKIDFKLCAAVYADEKHNMVLAAMADETQPKNKDTGASLTIYYAAEGEPLWDIARKYYTSVNAIKQENELSSEATTKDGMLLIPMK